MYVGHEPRLTEFLCLHKSQVRLISRSSQASLKGGRVTNSAPRRLARFASASGPVPVTDAEHGTHTRTFLGFTLRPLNVDARIGA